MAEALALSSARLPVWLQWPAKARDRPAGPVKGFLRGLFCGGTLADETMILAGEQLGPIRSNIPLSPELTLGSDLSSPSHLVIDFGDDVLPQGRPPPMIAPSLRPERLARVHPRGHHAPALDVTGTRAAAAAGRSDPRALDVKTIIAQMLQMGAMAAAPAIVRFVGGDVPMTLRTTRTMYEITLAEHLAYQIPILEFRDTPVGIGATKVVPTSILPQINTGMAGAVTGTGQVVDGLVNPPERCFPAALAKAVPATR